MSVSDRCEWYIHFHLSLYTHTILQNQLNFKHIYRWAEFFVNYDHSYVNAVMSTVATGALFNLYHFQ